MLYNFKNKFKLQKIKTLTFIILASWLLSGSYTLADTQETPESEKEEFIKKNKSLIATIAAGGGLVIILGVYYFVSNKEATNEDPNQGGGRYQQEKRIIRIPKDKLVSTLPLIYEQELKKLSKIENEELDKWKDMLEMQLNNEDSQQQFLQKLLNEPYRVNVNLPNHIGCAMIQLKKDEQDGSYIYIACEVTQQQKSNSGDKTSDIQQKLGTLLEKKLEKQFTNAIEKKSYKDYDMLQEKLRGKN